MSWYSHQWRPYVPVAQRRAKAARELAKQAKKSGLTASPVTLEGRKITRTFWGQAWCDNLEAYSDFANRLPRGRTYVRNGSVVDLQMTKGLVQARVAGSELYRISVKIKPLAAHLWKSIQTECAGKIDSLMELLQGRISSSVMEIVTRRDGGLFPTPRDIDLDCSCPDWADLCKHVAASLYGVGARLDQQPELLFLLRGVDPADLISQASAAEAVRESTRADGAPAMNEAELADVFGIELAPPAAAENGPSSSLPADATFPARRAKPARSKGKPSKQPKPISLKPESTPASRKKTSRLVSAKSPNAIKAKPKPKPKKSGKGRRATTKD